MSPRHHAENAKPTAHASEQSSQGVYNDECVMSRAFPGSSALHATKPYYCLNYWSLSTGLVLHFRNNELDCPYSKIPSAQRCLFIHLFRTRPFEHAEPWCWRGCAFRSSNQRRLSKGDLSDTLLLNFRGPLAANRIPSVVALANICRGISPKWLAQ